jgi:TolB-like protein
MNKQIFFLLLLAIIAYGQQPERVAIIQTVDDGDSIKFSDLAYLTDRLRETAVNILPKQRYGVMTTESIVAFLGSQERAQKECREASCLADLGRKVNADYVAQARIGRFNEKLTIKTELYNSKSGNLIGSFTGSSQNIDDLLSLIDEKAPVLFKKLPGVSNDISNLEKAVDYELGSEKDYFAKEKPYAATPEFEQPGKTSFWVAIGLDVLGVALISYAASENGQTKKAYDKYYVDGQSSSYYEKSWKDVEDSRGKRNKFYVIGGLVLASGIGVHIWF